MTTKLTQAIKVCNSKNNIIAEFEEFKISTNQWLRRDGKVTITLNDQTRWFEWTCKTNGCTLTTHHSRMLCVVAAPNVPSVVNMLNAMHRMKLCGMPHFPQVKPCKSSKPLRKLNANAGMFLKIGLLKEEHSSSMPQTLTSTTNSQRTNTTSLNSSNMGMTSSPNQMDGSEPPKTKPSSNSKVASGKPPLLTSLKRSTSLPNNLHSAKCSHK